MVGGGSRICGVFFLQKWENEVRGWEFDVRNSGSGCTWLYKGNQIMGLEWGGVDSKFKEGLG